MQGKIRGFLHLYIGEEAIAVGTMAALRPDDYVIGHYRDPRARHRQGHGHEDSHGGAVWQGDRAAAAARADSIATCSTSEKHFMGGHAIVAGQMPIAAGLALASKYRKEGPHYRVLLRRTGAVNQGEFHETLNLASVWKLPVLFLLENNLYGMGTHVDRSRAGGRHIYEAAAAYDIPGVQINGMDVTGHERMRQRDR